MKYRGFSAALLGLALSGGCLGQARAEDKAAPVRVVTLFTVDIQLGADGSAVETTHAEIRAANSGAAMAIGQTAVPYDSALQSLEIVEAHTLKKDGTKIPVDVSAIYDQLPPGAVQIPMFTDTRVKVIVFPQFSAGDTAVYTFKVTAKHPIYPGQFWYGDLFPRNAAFDEVRETLTAPKDMRLYIENHDVAFTKSEENGRAVYHWHYSAPVPADVKSAAVSPLSNIPRLIVSTFPDYAALGRAYAAAAAPEMTVTPAIQALADSITKGVSDPREQTRKIYEWLTGHIRYVAVELGRGTMVPHPAETVLTNGYGDCKDHVALLGTLLKAKGIASEGVLINSGSDYELTDVPMFIGLDHIITYVPALNLYLDSTAIVAPFGTLPFQEYGKPVVYASQTNPRRGTMPVLPPGQATTTMKTASHLGKDGQLTGTTTTTATGPFAVMLRLAGLGIESLGPENAAKKLMTGLGYGSDASGQLQAPPPTAAGADYTVSGNFSVGGWDDALAGKHGFYLPGGMRLLGLSGEGLMGTLGGRDAKADFDFPCYSAQATEDLSLEAPADVRFESVPQDTHVKTANIQFDAHWTLSGQTMSVHRAFASNIDQPFCTAAIRQANAAALKEIADSYNTNLSFIPTAEQSSQSGGTTVPPPQNSSGSSDLSASDLAPLISGGLADAQNGQPKDAIAKYDQALKLDPKSATAFYDRGIAYAAMNDYARAIQDFDQAIALTPDSADMLSDRGRAYHLMGDDNRALQDLDRAIALEPNHFLAHYNRGTVYAGQHKYEQAIKEFNTTIAINPAYSYAYANRAAAYADLKQYQQAIDDFTKTIALDPSISQAYAGRGALYGKLYESEKALADLNKALSLAPDLAPALPIRAAIYSELYRFDDALADMNKAISLAPDDAKLVMGRAAIYQHMADWTHALADCDTVLSKPAALSSALKISAFHMRADVLMELGRYQEAIRDYTAELKEAGDPNALVLRAIAYEWTGLHQQAEADIKAAVQQGGENAEADFATITAHKGTGTIAPPSHTAAPPSPPPVPAGANGVTKPTAANEHSSENYPPLSRRLLEEGPVVLAYTVDADGSVSDPAVAVSSRFPGLDAAALDAVKQWRYHPAEKDGKPVAVRWMATVVYRMRN